MRQSVARIMAANLAVILVSLAVVTAQAQEATIGATVPRVIQFSGVLKNSAGQPLAGVQGVQFALYRDQEGGAPLWIESQNVAADEYGRFAVLLGAATVGGTSGGLPVELFSSGESRWLGVQPQTSSESGGEPEMPRVLLVSVPYALKASDAETLGGLPPSAFVLAADAVTERVKDSGGLTVAAVSDGLITAQANAGTAGFIGKFFNTTDLDNSTLFQSGSNIGLGTTTPESVLHLQGASTDGITVSNGLNSGIGFLRFKRADGAIAGEIRSLLGTQAMVFNATGAERMRIAPSGFVGIGTNSPIAQLHVSGPGSTRMLFQGDAGTTGLIGLDMDSTARRWSLGAKGTNEDGAFILFDFTASQRRMTVDSSGRFGIGKTNPSTLLDVNGTVTATAFEGDGSALTGITTDALADASVTAAKVADDVATQAELDAEAVSRAAADSTLDNAKVAKAGDTMSGTLNLPADGLVVGSTQLVATGGNVGVGTAGPVEKLEVAGNVKATAFLGDGSALVVDGATVLDLLNRIAALEGQLACFPGGCHLWSQRFGNIAGTQFGIEVAVDSSGNVVVTGYFQGTVDFGGGGLTSAGGSDIFVAKYSGSDGSHVWSKQFGDTGTDRGRGVAVDSSGNVLVVGLFNGTVDFGGGGLTSTGGDDIIVAKLSGADGSHVWSKDFGDTGTDNAYRVAVNSSDDAVVTGWFNGTVDFGGGGLTSAGGSDIFVAKYSGSDGSHLWSKDFGDTSTDQGRGVAVDTSGNVLVTGYFQGTVDFGGGGLTSAGGQDVFIAKYSGSDGSHVWSKDFGDTGTDQSFGVAVDSSGNMIVTGWFEGTVDFGGGGLTSAGGNDIFVGKYSSADGSHLWSKDFGDTGSDQGIGIAADASGNAVVTGSFNGTVDFGGGGLTSAGGNDIFVGKYSGADGSHVWSNSFGDTGSDQGIGIAVDASGNAVVTGGFEGTVDFGGGGLTSAGGDDIFLIKVLR